MWIIEGEEVNKEDWEVSHRDIEAENDGKPYQLDSDLPDAPLDYSETQTFDEHIR